MKSTMINGRLLVLAVTVAVALAAAGTALSLMSFTDPAGDSGGAPDITAVTVDHDTSGNITFTVRTNKPTLAPDASILVDLDTNPGSAGVEYRLIGPPNPPFAVLVMFVPGSAFARPVSGSTATASYASGVARFVVNKSDIGNTSEFSFLIRSGDNGPIADRAPDSGFYSYSLSAPAPATVDVGKVVVRKPGVHAGKSFTISAPVTTEASAVKVTCTAHIGRRLVRMRARSSAAGTATCTGTAPKGTAGKRLVGRMTAAIGGTQDTSTFSFVIRK